MGSNIARNFANHGHTVAVYNRTTAKTEAFMEEFGDTGNFVSSATIEDFVASLERPRRALIMVAAGAGTDAVINQLADAMDEGDIIIDGGNALYTDTIRREKEMSERNLMFVGAGISGGEEGALNGPAIMPGGPKESYESLGPLMESISAQVDGVPCCTHIGPDGAGHFVKMVHNGIEYADMQVIGEAHELLRSVAGLEPAEQADVFDRWNTTELSSYLIEITAQVLRQVDPKTGKPFIDIVADAAGQKGTGRWTVQEALELGSPVTAIAESVFARALSSSEPAMRKEAQEVLPAGIGDTTEDVVKDPGFVEDVRKALYASKLVAYAQGLDMLTMAGREYGWTLDLATIASLWRNGCIIRAELLNVIMKAYEGDKAPLNLLFAPEFVKSIEDALPAWRRVVARAVERGIPAPVFSSALAYYDGLRRPRLNAALTQGLRDYFGAHTYKRIDDPESSFHVLWSGDRSEVVS